MTILNQSPLRPVGAPRRCASLAPGHPFAPPCTGLVACPVDAHRTLRRHRRRLGREDAGRRRRRRELRAASLCRGARAGREHVELPHTFLRHASFPSARRSSRSRARGARCRRCSRRAARLRRRCSMARCTSAAATTASAAAASISSLDGRAPVAFLRQRPRRRLPPLRGAAERGGPRGRRRLLVSWVGQVLDERVPSSGGRRVGGGASDALRSALRRRRSARRATLRVRRPGRGARPPEDAELGSAPL